MDEITIKAIIEKYNAGASLYQLAKEYKSYPMTICRILEKNHITLRHDTMETGEHTAKNGEKLIEWAKAQGRLVTKSELAKVLGRTRLPHSYFTKYPELGNYVQAHGEKAWKTYINQLFDWLKKNNIPYKPNDKKLLNGWSVQALLLEEYANIAIQIDIKPQYMSIPRYKHTIEGKIKKAHEKGVTIILLNEKHFENLDQIKKLLDEAKHSTKESDENK